MTEYVCDKCKKTFKFKSLYTSHMNRKTSCVKHEVKHDIIINELNNNNIQENIKHHIKEVTNTINIVQLILRIDDKKEYERIEKLFMKVATKMLRDVPNIIIEVVNYYDLLDDDDE